MDSETFKARVLEARNELAYLLTVAPVGVQEPLDRALAWIRVAALPDSSGELKDALTEKATA